MSRESTREYYRRKAQEEREGKNDSAQSTTSSTREYYRKKAQEERETRKPDTNTVSGGASGSGPVVNNSTTTKPNLPAKPAKPVEPAKPAEAVKPAETGAKSVEVAAKPVAATPVAKVDANGVVKLPTVEVQAVKRDEPIVTPEPVKPMEALKSVTQKLKGITQALPQQAILHKTGIIADAAT
ncbi:MAG: hypothetical protein J6S18_04140, partial [Oscillospiraceae bacterium]|nr:hypothetical protein [Oscillospiraceae bacterium]